MAALHGDVSRLCRKYGACRVRRAGRPGLSANAFFFSFLYSLFFLIFPEFLALAQKAAWVPNCLYALPSSTFSFNLFFIFRPDEVLNTCPRFGIELDRSMDRSFDRGNV